jgi:hypothetical protein
MEAHLLLADPFNAPVVDGSDATEKTEAWAIINMSGSQVVRRRESALWSGSAPATAGEFPELMKVSHTNVGTGNKARMRHLIRLDTPVLRDGNDEGMNASVYLVADLPDICDNRNVAIAGLWQRMTGLLYGASAVSANSFDMDTFWNRWVNGES